MHFTLIYFAYLNPIPIWPEAAAQLVERSTHDPKFVILNPAYDSMSLEFTLCIQNLPLYGQKRQHNWSTHDPNVVSIDNGKKGWPLKT